MKNEKIDEIMSEYVIHEIVENSDSTIKKLIYQAPFNKVNIMTNLLEKLQEEIGEQTYIDVEVNTLEDAYINIAKEEEKLLKELQEKGF